jgi:beta-xylosidase
VQRLSADGMRLEGEPVDTGLKQTQPWHGALVEAPTVVLRDGTYVLFYSANDYGSDAYAMGYATATAVTGPYVDRSEQPWVDTEGDAAGPGGQAVLTLDDEQWLVYHAWEPGEEGYPEGRRGMWLDRLTWRRAPLPDRRSRCSRDRPAQRGAARTARRRVGPTADGARDVSRRARPPWPARSPAPGRGPRAW